MKTKLILLLSLIATCISHRCIHDELLQKDNEILIPVDRHRMTSEEHSSKEGDDDFRALRIKVIYENNEELDHGTGDYIK